MSNNLSWAGINSGSSGGSKGGGSGAIVLLLLFGGLCCCMLVCGGLGWWGYKEGWFDDLFKKKDDGTQAPTVEEEDDTEDPPDPDDPPPASDGEVTTTVNKTDKGYYCKSPWARHYIRFNKDGKNPRCCEKADSNYKWCKAEDIVTVPNKDFAVGDLHANVRRIGKDNLGSIGLVQGTCVPPSGRGDKVEAISYLERNSKKNVQQLWCHPTKGGAKGYALYPVCFENNGTKLAPNSVKIDRNANKCSNGTDIRWRPRSDTNVFKTEADRFKYVDGGSRA